MATISPNLVRDDIYYFEDGNCVIQVENRLFNLHRFILRRHSKVFEDMFSVPRPTQTSGDTVLDGTDNDHPILCDDALEAFRAWCWILYAGFHERQELTAREFGQSSLKDSIHLGLLAHKYQCSSIEQWALNIINLALTPEDQRAPESNACTGPPPSEETLEYLVRTCWKCRWDGPIKARSQQLLLDTYFPPNFARHPFGHLNSIEPEPQSGAELRKVLELAEEIGSVELKVKAYYKFWCSMEWRLSPSIHGNSRLDLGKLTTLCGDGRQRCCEPLNCLTEAQKHTLYRGFHVLSSLRDELQNVPLVENPISPPYYCARPEALQRIWRTEVQKFVTSHIGPAEILLEMKKRLRCSECTLANKDRCDVQRLQANIEKFLDDLDIFLIGVFGD